MSQRYMLRKFWAKYALIGAICKESLVQLEHQTAITGSSAWIATKMLHLFPHKTSVVYRLYSPNGGKCQLSELVPSCEAWWTDRPHTHSFLATKLGFILLDMQALTITENSVLIHQMPSHGVLWLQLGLLGQFFLFAPICYTHSDNIFWLLVWL